MKSIRQQAFKAPVQGSHEQVARQAMAGNAVVAVALQLVTHLIRCHPMHGPWSLLPITPVSGVQLGALPVPLPFHRHPRPSSLARSLVPLSLDVLVGCVVDVASRATYFLYLNALPIPIIRTNSPCHVQSPISSPHLPNPSKKLFAIRPCITFPAASCIFGCTCQSSCLARHQRVDISRRRPIHFGTAVD
jgi:hypothetical protein